MRKLEIYLFAPFRVVVNGRTISADRWQGRIPRSLLKVLALSRHGCTSDRLLELFWPDQPPTQARQRLYETISRLRRTLVGQPRKGPVTGSSIWPIETFESGYRLADSTWIDVCAFHDQVSTIRRLRAADPAAAIHLLLNGERPDPDALLADDPYADWALTARERLYEDVRLLEQMKAELCLQHGRPADALGALQAILRLDPTSEQSGRQAMEIAWQLGKRKTAMAIFDRIRRALFEDVGVEPSEETLALYRHIVEARPLPSQFATTAPMVSPPRRDDGASAYSANGRLLGSPPVYLTRFVGRERELLEITDSHCTTRLLTLHGPGGTGKTRLALEVVTRMRGSYTHGVCWIDLAAVHHARLLPRTIATAVGIRENRSDTLLETMCDVVKPRRMLFVLDNCEHLVADVGAIVDRLLRTCPKLSIIATSQAALGLPGEKIYPVSPLSVPDEDGSLSVAGIAGYGSVALFVERAAAVRRGFRLTAQNADCVARICRRLHGNPLAIELAASKLAALTPGQIASRLDQRFHLLQREHTAGPVRHRSLRALLDWSYDLLPDLERKLWERMSVFTGPFSLETIESMFQDEKNAPPNHVVLDAVCRLVERSILVAEESGGAMRYRFLETMREYGLLKLHLSGAEWHAKKRHLRWCLDLVRQGAAAYCRRDEMEWMQRLVVEYDEIRTALAWSIKQRDSEASLQLVSSLWWFWMLRGWVDEGRSFGNMALEKAGERGDELYAMALHTMGALSLWLGEGGAAKTYLQRSLQILERASDSHHLALVHLSLGLVLLAESNLDDAEKALHTSVALGRRLHDEGNLATALWHLGSIALDKGDLETAQALFHESLSLCRRLGYERGEVGCLGGLGMIAFHQSHEQLAVQTLEDGIALSRRLHDHVFGSLLMDYLGWIARRRQEYDRSLSLHQESLRWRWSVRDRTGAANTLGHLAETALCLGEYEKAARLFGAQQSWSSADAAGLPLPCAVTLDRSAALSRLESVLSPSVLEAASLTSHLMEPQDVVAYALRQD